MTNQHSRRDFRCYRSPNCPRRGDSDRTRDLPGGTAPRAAIQRYRLVTGIRRTATTAISQRVPRRSIMVLPFANLSNEEQQYFADGITEDLTADLSRRANVMVISCNTAFTYRNKQIGHEIGVIIRL
jgi:hypothetical protein